MAGKDGQDPCINKISSAIRVILDFPKPGSLGLYSLFQLNIYMIYFCLFTLLIDNDNNSYDQKENAMGYGGPPEMT